ncbi:fibrinogen-like protein 1 [Haliotis rubra]|uniref:fibrinogen-like protein 1 n=1 Tax=Haliotis rubra TaxID=36100 RepID=UPI001EE58290|nr:fibrinogen-like protein 1 [Haliotis rubra]
MFLLIVLHFLAVCGQEDITSNFFEKVGICSVAPSVIIQTKQVKSKIGCASICVVTENCKSFSISRIVPRMCYLNNDILVDTGCSSVTHAHYNMIQDNPCLNGGIYDKATQKCRCFNSYVGEYCERLMYDCYDGYQSGHYDGEEKAFYVHPTTSPSKFKVFCEMQRGGILIVMRTATWYSSEDFNRTWDEYKAGFGNLEAGENFWLGNERLYFVSNYRNMTLNIQIVYGNSWNFRQHYYSSFKISDEASSYRASYESAYTHSSANHQLGNCMKQQGDMMFTTIDRDNDLNAGGNCAQIHQSGWWYNNCGGCNPTGSCSPIPSMSRTRIRLTPKSLWWATRRPDFCR